MTVSHLSEKELSMQLEEAHTKVEVGGLYAHYRDRSHPYKVLNIGIIEATQEVAIIYQKSYGAIWIRPLSSWLEKVEVEGSLVPRFQKL